MKLCWNTVRRLINLRESLHVILNTMRYSLFRTEIVSIFQNLITNSIKYRKRDQQLEIAVSSQQQNNRLEICFSDNGQGIDLKEFEGKLFGMFQRFTADSGISGTGVGMYIIKKLVDKNNGNIALKSEPNKGLAYRIELPVG